MSQDEVTAIALDVWRSALTAVPDSTFLFADDRHLVFAKISSPALSAWSEARLGKSCCEMFWQTEGPGQCVVDRALNSGVKAEFELIAGTSEAIPFFITVRPLFASDDIFASDDTTPTGVLLTARDISDLRQNQ